MTENIQSGSTNILKIFDEMFSKDKDISKYFHKDLEIECRSSLFKCRNFKEFQEAYNTLRTILPDFKKIPLSCAMKDDKVFVLYKSSGTHTGEIREGISPTNKHAEWYSTSIYTMKNGLITHLLTIFNELDLCKQLGWDVNNLPKLY